MTVSPGAGGRCAADSGRQGRLSTTGCSSDGARIRAWHSRCST